MPKRWLALAAGVSLLFAGSRSFAASPNYFAGKTITYIVATSPGGGYDTYGRLIARYMQKYLPGSRIIVKNVPGAGNIIGANTIYAAKADGLTIGMFNTGLIYDQLIGRKGVMFDLTKFTWIGKASFETRGVLLSRASGLKSFDDMMKSRTPVKFATSGIGAASYFDTRILADALGLNIVTVNNFTGNEGEMSMMRGEVAGQVGTIDSFDQFVKNGHGYVALALSGSEKELPGVPRVDRYIKDDKGKKLIGLLQGLSEMGRLTAGPPNIPAEALAAERAAFVQTMKDPEFLNEAKKLLLPIDYLPGDVVATKMQTILKQSPDTVAALKRAAGG